MLKDQLIPLEQTFLKCRFLSSKSVWGPLFCILNNSQFLLVLLVQELDFEQGLSVKCTIKEIGTCIWSLPFHTTHSRQMD